MVRSAMHFLFEKQCQIEKYYGKQQKQILRKIEITRRSTVQTPIINNWQKIKAFRATQQAIGKDTR